jgi:2'-5' RNA ligase
MSRLFLAIAVPDEVKAQMEQVQGELRRAAPAGRISWTKSGQFHLTLKFLGNVDAQRIEALTDAVGGVCREFGPLRLRAQQVGAFPNFRKPRVIWVGLNEVQDRLAPLQRALEVACRNFTAEESQERFTGHVTLARVKTINPAEVNSLAAAAAAWAQRVFGEWAAGEVELMESQLSSEGAKHTLLKAIPLAA